MKKYAVLSVLLLLISSPIMAKHVLIGGGVGYTTFNDTFTSGVNGQAKVSIMSKSGIALDGSIRYISTDSEKKSNPDLKMIPILAGITYYVSPSKKVSPYVGASAGAAVMNSSFDTPSLIYGGKAGVLMHITPEIGVYVEGEALTLTDDKTSLSIQPAMVSFGMVMTFGGRNEMKKRMPPPPPKNLTPMERKDARQRRHRLRQHHDDRRPEPPRRRPR